MFESAFGEIEKISIDYGVMEGARDVVVIPAEFGWSDVGHWGALRELLGSDDDGNSTMGHAVLHDSRDTLVFSTTDRVVAVVGLEGVVVVDTEDALLVLPASRAQDVRAIVAALDAAGATDKL